MSVTLSRRIAFEILLRVEKAGGYASDLLHARLGNSVSQPDAALATELTMGVLRWRRLLDFLFADRVGRPLDALDLEVLTALRLGFYQLRFLDRVPPHAAVNEAVELVTFAKKRSAAGFVNAVLRNSVASARKPVQELVPGDLTPAERLGLLHSHPTWMVERWLRRFGMPQTIALLESNNRVPPLTGFVVDPAKRDDIISELSQAGATVTSGRWLREAFTVSGFALAGATPFRAGKAFLQDEASQMVAVLLDVRGGDSVLDLCAPPGGKTALLARALKPGTTMIAGDLHPSRLVSMRRRLSAAGIVNVQYIGLNATRPLPLAKQFDRILADAPCSGTGTLSRNPEIRWRLGPRDLASLHERQVKLLAQAVAAMAPAGRLIYSTCSLEAEENEDVVRAVISRQPNVRMAQSAKILKPHLVVGQSVGDLFDVDGFMRTFPHQHHTDGFFVAALER
jgi:16S rRNA (cytosine967-C5)-methyltransferase